MPTVRFEFGALALEARGWRWPWRPVLALCRVCPGLGVHKLQRLSPPVPGKREGERAQIQGGGLLVSFRGGLRGARAEIVALVQLCARRCSCEGRFVM